MDDINWTGQEPEQYKELVYALLDTTRILSPSSMEKEMTDFCAIQLGRYGFSVNVDHHGNITAVRGSLPRYINLNAHMDVFLGGIPGVTTSRNPLYEAAADEVKSAVKPLINELRKNLVYLNTEAGKYKRESPERESIQKEYYAASAELSRLNNETDKKLHQLRQDYPYIFHIPTGYWRPEEIRYFPKSGNINHTKGNADIYIGGDDKCGVAIILTLAKLTTYPFKVVLSTREEPPFEGVRGIKSVDPVFFADVGASITIDKRGNNALVDRINNKKLCDKSLIQTIVGIGLNCGIKFAVQTGLEADAYTIADYTPAVNMSCGYYDPHTPGDHIKVPEVFRTMCVVNGIIEHHNSLV